MRTAIASICLAAMMAACAGGPHEQRAAGGDKLYEAVTGGSSAWLAIVDTRSHATERKLTLGVPSPDWKHVYTTVGSSVVDTDPRTGATSNAARLDATYHLPAATASGVPGGLSPDGRWLVVERFDGPAAAPTTTHMLVIDTSTLKVLRPVNLPGYFEFDAISFAGSNLYLIQHLNGREYYVRLYDVGRGVLADNIVVDKSDGNQAMTGLRLSGVASTDGHWLFSMYVRPHEAPFIHALSLDGPFAFCLDLPGGGYLDDPAEMQWSLAMSPDGMLLYAVNPATGAAAAITNGGNGAPDIVRTARFTRSSSAGATSQPASSAVVAGSMLVAGGPLGLVWIDVSTLKPASRLIESSSVAGVGLSPDGKHLYAVSDRGVVMQVTVDTRGVEGVFDPSAGTPMALMRVAAA